MSLKIALVVDDSKVARMGLMKILQKQGLQVDSAASGIEALDYLKTKQPDVIFMDFFMPDMDGPDATRAIRANSQTKLIPIVMCTSKESSEDQLYAKLAGANAFIIKPATAEVLETVLRNIKNHSPQKESPKVSPAIVSPLATQGPVTVTSDNSLSHPQKEVSMEQLQSLVKTFCLDALHEYSEDVSKELVMKEVKQQIDHYSEKSLKSMTREIATATAQNISLDIAKTVAFDIAQTTAKQIAQNISLESIKTLEKSLEHHFESKMDHLLRSAHFMSTVEQIAARYAENHSKLITEKIALNIAQVTARDICRRYTDEFIENNVYPQIKKLKIISFGISGLFLLLLMALVFKVFLT